MILVHGWTGSPLTGTAAGLENRLRGRISTFTFDYSTWAADWPTNANIAPCLAEYVANVSAAYRQAGGDGKVVLVAHSMGGLAIRYASDGRYTANPITSAEAPLVVSLDTPYLGSFWGGLALPLGKELFGAVSGKSVPNPFGTDASACLDEHDQAQQLPSQCGGLPPWLSGGTTLDEIAGDITIQRTLLGVHLYDIDTGSDGIVSRASSTGYRTSGPGGVAPVVSSPTSGATLHSQYVNCQVTTGQVRNAFNLFGGVASTLGYPVEAISDWVVLNELQSGQGGKESVVYSAAALVTAGCSHIHIATDDAALDQAESDIRGYLDTHPTPVTSRDLLSAPVPALRGNPAGTLRNGTLDFPMGGSTWLEKTGGSAPAFGDITGDGVADAAAVIGSTSGAGGADQYVELYTNGNHLLGGFDPARVDPNGYHAYVHAMIIRDGAILLDWSTDHGGGQGGQSYWSGKLTWNGQRVLLSDLTTHTGITGSGLWTDPQLTIGPDGLGAVRLGMSEQQASDAAGIYFDGAGDGYAYPTDLPDGSLHLYVGGATGPIRCVGAESTGAGNAQSVATQEGVAIGDPASKIRQAYSDAAQYVPSPQSGMSPHPGYVLTAGNRRVVFMLDPTGNTIVGIAAGGTDLTPSSCTG